MGARLHWRTGIVAHHRSPPPGCPSLPFPGCGPPRTDARGLAGVVASVVVGVVAGTAILGACSGGGGGGGTAAASVDNHEACARLDELDRGADAIAQVNVADPDQFRADFDRAVDRYVSALSKLRKVAPASLHEPIDELRRDVSRHDFADGAAARARLAAFATKECGAAPTSGPTNS